MLHPAKPNSITYSRFTLHYHKTQLHNIFKPHTPPPNIVNLFTLRTDIPIFNIYNNNSLSLTTKCTPHNPLSLPITSHDGIDNNEKPRKYQQHEEKQEAKDKSFWGAVSLIIGTAVGPGMLGLPAATIRSGSLPSTVTILLCWVYVISSILIVAELSFAAMEEDGVEEVSFTGLATKALGSHFGAFVAVVYASLSFSLLVACVSGIGSIVSQWFPLTNTVLVHALFPVLVGVLIRFFPFKTIDVANRLLCSFMLFSITALVGIGLSVAKTNVLGSFAHGTWSLSSILPAIPVTVLTLGFHVITPFICKIAGNSVSEARKAVLIGGTVPLIMVLSWNLIVLGLAGTNASSRDPISLLLSVNPSALSAVQGFAFSALGTSLIGYAVSFPKQITDTVKLLFEYYNSTKQICIPSQMVPGGKHNGRVGFVTYSGSCNLGHAGKVSFNGSKCVFASDDEQVSSGAGFKSFEMFIVPLVLGVPVFIGSLFPSTFSRALDFAGVYANCFLFGILPPVMAYVQQSRKKLRSIILPRGDGALLLLFGIAVFLGIWH
ncbi:Trp_Tyr_perm domain-containing protein [Cephalotus follicularis]|uniref:Trp_Tyr_perm domain-containing protein n=1 Tax=Cephalotus follicularis TaxID=3775 RepID=A0A1Q3D106_CEPFO|nr:Trp_Tyr_perm domain-containing protein [Cephalotus follicularis]